MFRILLFALMLAAPLNAQNQEAPDDTGWTWQAKAIFEGFLAGAAVGGLVGMVYCSEEKPSWGAAMDVAPPVPVPNCDKSEGKHIKTPVKRAVIGSLIGMPVVLFIHHIARDVRGEDIGAKLRVGPDPYRPEGISVEIRLPLQP